MIPLFLTSLLCRVIIIRRGGTIVDHAIDRSVTRQNRNTGYPSSSAEITDSISGRFNDEDRDDWSRPSVAMQKQQRTFQVRFLPPGENPLHVTTLPAGTCSYCCPIDVDRDIEYLLFTRRNPTCGTTLNISDPYSLRKSNFNDRYPTVIFIHGYSGSARAGSATAIRDVYLKRGEYNIILVHWTKLAGLPWYVTAVRNTRIVGPQVARLVNWLDAQGAISLASLHVIGFSLGAEIAGFMGKALAPRKVGRITGLDAAYPLYMNTGGDGHLTKTDAMFVDVIHTDGGNFGFPNPLGHVDFYPNGGKPIQPGCNLDSVIRRSVSRLINQYIVCGHNRAWMFYAESVTNPFGFPASQCPKWHPNIQAQCTWTPDVLMGFAVDPRVRGKFYLRTNAQAPFARNATGYIRK